METKKRNRKKRQKWLESEEFFADALQHPPINEEMIEWFKRKWEFMRRDPNFDPNSFPQPLNKIIDPNKRFDELWGSNDLLKVFLYFHDFMPIKIKTESDYNYSKFKLSFEIDFTKINSLNDLKKAIGDIVDITWFAYDKRINHKTNKDQKDYELIIKAGDLKKDYPYLSFAEIGKLIMPEYPEDVAAKRAQRHCDEYKRLTNGGWKTLSYP
jgi:hypothetical protein